MSKHASAAADPDLPRALPAADALLRMRAGAAPRWVGEPPPKPPATDACRTIKAPVLPLVCQHLHPVLPALRYPVSIRVKRLAYGGIESGIQGTQSLAGVQGWRPTPAAARVGQLDIAYRHAALPPTA